MAVADYPMNALSGYGGQHSPNMPLQQGGNALGYNAPNMGQDETYAAYMQAMQREQAAAQMRHILSMGAGVGAYLGGRPMGAMRSLGAGAATGLGLNAGMEAWDIGTRGQGSPELDAMYRDTAGIPRVPQNR